MNEEKWFVAGFVLLAIGLGALIVHSERSWHRYVEEHHCLRTGARAPYTYTTYTTMMVGKTMIQIPHQQVGYRIEWACDGGERIWR